MMRSKYIIFTLLILIIALLSTVMLSLLGCLDDFLLLLATLITLTGIYSLSVLLLLKRL